MPSTKYQAGEMHFKRSCPCGVVTEYPLKEVVLTSEPRWVEFHCSSCNKKFEVTLWAKEEEKEELEDYLL
jgi:hypothetical protein